MNIPVFNSLIGRGVSCFFVGAFLKHIVDRCQRGKKTCHTKIGYALIAIVLLCCLIKKFIVPSFFENFLLAFIIGVCPSIIFAVIFRNPLSRILSTLPFIFLGNLSIGLYLWHYPVQIFIDSINIFFKLNWDYSSYKFWMVIVVSTIIFVFLYQKFLHDRMGLLIKIFIK